LDTIPKLSHQNLEPCVTRIVIATGSAYPNAISFVLDDGRIVEPGLPPELLGRMILCRVVAVS